jgi:hypothetical protein
MNRDREVEPRKRDPGLSKLLDVFSDKEQRLARRMKALDDMHNMVNRVKADLDLSFRVMDAIRLRLALDDATEAYHLAYWYLAAFDRNRAHTNAAGTAAGAREVVRRASEDAITAAARALGGAKQATNGTKGRMPWETERAEVVWLQVALQEIFSLVEDNAASVEPERGVAEIVTAVMGQTQHPKIIFVPGDSICDVCSETYWRHPEHPRCHWLKVACDGRVIMPIREAKP